MPVSFFKRDRKKLLFLGLLLALSGCAVMDPLKTWDNGSTLAVCFVDPAPVGIRQRIAAAAAEWTRWANLTFDFGDPPAPRMCDTARVYDITIGFGRDGSASLVGIDSRDKVPSMNLGHFDDPTNAALQDPREFNRIVLHEFGHAIGLEHEFQSPNGMCNAKLDWDKARAFYRQHMGWSGADVDSNLKTINTHGRSLLVSPYDVKSIMQYALPAEVFSDGTADPCYTARTYELSPTDKIWVGRMYPKSAAGT